MKKKLNKYKQKIYCKCNGLEQMMEKNQFVQLVEKRSYEC